MTSRGFAHCGLLVQHVHLEIIWTRDHTVNSVSTYLPSGTVSVSGNGTLIEGTATVSGNNVFNWRFTRNQLRVGRR